MSWLAAQMISFIAGGGIFNPSLKAIDIMAPYKKQVFKKEQPSDRVDNNYYIVFNE